MQVNAFRQGEGDQWWLRNRREILARKPEADWPLRLIERNHLNLEGKGVFEYGAANGYRLNWIWTLKGTKPPWGYEMSVAALKDGCEDYPWMRLYDRLEFISGNFDLVICHFVLHWIDRSGLVSVMSELDRLVAQGGHLLIGDFLPDYPTKVPYHHREGLWTYKCDYARLFEDTGNYRRMDRVIFDHDTGQENCDEPYRRAAVTLLRKEDCYEEGVARK